ncbi:MULTISPECIES: DUF2490 domain-containing protein [unclassified Polaribacter]|uniref:DUF2490 domain-containing protein n=1 Tax=unclassified Polaribacter TaxID=196858 RepID=UPI001CB88BB5|nr:MULTISPECIES: DUF2490 domain-containing protein [unclassified Polaribacter]
MFSQSDAFLGFLPKGVVSKKINATSKWVNSLESRTVVRDNEYLFSQSLVDISSIYSTKTFENQSFNFGYILRFRNFETIHRTFQHYNFVNNYSSLNVGHRFAFEQFYQTNKKTTYRTRYRVSAVKPLNGERVDVKELYFKLGNEYLYDFKDADLEVRVTPYIGYQATKYDKIEFGIDYRISNFINNSSENQFWFRTTWYISLD